MQISIAMATYQGERYLRSQLDSLANQTQLPHEVVICDDRSTDDTANVVADFARTAPFPVRWHVNPQRLHFADNFLRAASLCQGTHVAFCDQDDIWHANKLDIVTRAFRSTSACLVAHEAKMIDDSGKVLGVLRSPVPAGRVTGDDLHPWGFFFGLTCTVDRRVLQLIEPARRPFDIRDPRRRLGHDRWIAFLASLYGDIHVIDRSLADYRIHTSSASAWMRARRGPLAKLHIARTCFGSSLLKQQIIAEEFSALIQDLMKTLLQNADNAQRERLTAAAERWRIFALRCADRYDITRADSRAERLRRWVAAVSNDGYRDFKSNSVRVSSAVQDLGLAVVAAPRQETYANWLVQQRPD